MNPEQIATIDEVISALEIIIAESEQKNDPAGYFAALYQKVTIRVKEGIASGFFDDGPRMEQMDVAFAKRYLSAHASFLNGELLCRGKKRLNSQPITSPSFCSICFWE